MSFSALFLSLQQEGFLIRSSICTGLTELRNANLGERGRYYTAFFQLAIALERFTKLALILDYMVANDLTPPGGQAVRGYGHDISSLFAKAQAIATAHGYPIAGDFKIGQIESAILNYLSEFAQTARYANLDALASGARGINPLARWHEVLIEIVRLHVSQKRLARIEQEAAEAAEVLEGILLVRAHDLSDLPLTQQAWLAQPQIYSLAARHATWYCFKLFSLLKDLVRSLTHDAIDLDLKRQSQIANIPEMSDFFDFLWADRDTVLRKKKWP